MKRVGAVFLVLAIGVLGLSWLRPAAAHQDGCHRYHSCPADDGSYRCGDLGYVCDTRGTAADPALASRGASAANPAPSPAPAANPAAATPAPAAAPAAEEQRTNLPRTGIKLEYLLAAIEISLFLAGVVLIIGDPWLRRRPT